MVNEKDKVIDVEGLSHFKAKQDLENANKFQKKGETDLTGAVRYDAAQALTEQEKAQARMNIGAAAPGEGGGGGGSVEGAVQYNAAQNLTDEQKLQARANIGTTDGTWESMPDKPFGINGWVIEWDTNPTDTFVEVMDGMGFYKASDSTPTKEELIGATYIGGDGEGKPTEFVLTESDIADYNADCYGLVANPCFLITTQATEVEMFGMTLPFLSAGTWFITFDLPTSLSKGELKKIDKKFLPDDITPELPEGIVTTDESGLIPASVLPSYVDDVVEGYYDPQPNYPEETFFKDGSGLKLNAESGKIYVDLNTGNTYRWSGSVYVRLNPDEYTIATTSDIDALFT